MDLTWLPPLLTGGLGVAVVGSAGALIGAGVESRREHKRWLRDVRLKHYERFITAANALVVADQLGGASDAEKLKLQAAENVLGLIGPSDIYSYAKGATDYAILVASNPKALDAYLNGVADFNREARSVLGIPDKGPFPRGRP